MENENNDKVMHNKVMSMFADTIKAKDGKPVLMDTMDCITFRFATVDRRGCAGCQSELQCTKLTTLLMLDVFSRTGQIAMFGVKSGFAVMEHMVDIVRAKDLDTLNSVLPMAFRKQMDK